MLDAKNNDGLTPLQLAETLEETTSIQRLWEASTK